MGQNIEIPFQDRSVFAYLSKPPDGEPGGIRPVLVLHPWWGLNDFMRGLCDRLAAEGFTALAPDYYRGVVVSTIPDAETMSERLDKRLAIQDILAGVGYLHALAGNGTQQMGLIGFSLGASLGIVAAEKRSEEIGAVVLFYGASQMKIQNSRAAFQVHLAESDPYVTTEERHGLAINLQQAGVEASLYEYTDTGHWFFEEDRPESFRPAAAKLAWQRTLELFNAKLAG